MKPPTPRLAAVEAAEQAQKLRVVDEELAGVGEEAVGEGENRGMAAGINTGGGGSTRWRPEAEYREEEEGIQNVMDRPI
jgi:hypothetical protein